MAEVCFFFTSFECMTERQRERGGKWFNSRGSLKIQLLCDLCTLYNNINSRYDHVSTSIYMLLLLLLFHSFSTSFSSSSFFSQNRSVSWEHYSFPLLLFKCTLLCDNHCSSRRKKRINIVYETRLYCPNLIVHRMGSVFSCSLNSYYLLDIITRVSCKFIYNIQNEHWVQKVGECFVEKKERKHEHTGQWEVEITLLQLEASDLYLCVPKAMYKFAF